MEGYFSPTDNSLKISVSNVPEFQKLLSQAKKEADQLQETIHQLENFSLNIRFDC